MTEQFPQLNIVIGAWGTLQADAQAIRHEVFVLEQNVPAEIEMDANDILCLHAVAYDEDGTAIATGRLLPDGHIGRMAVRDSARNRGVGAEILRVLMEQARLRGHGAVQLNAQISAENFYQREGFAREGELFEEAGITHIHMVRKL